MPTQNTTIDEGLEGCGSVRISYSPTATPNTPLLEDDAGRYLLVDRTEPTQALKIVLQYTPASDPYDSYTATYRVTGSFTSWGGDAYITRPYDETFTQYSFGRGPYHRRDTRAIVEDYPGGHNYQTRMRFYCAPVISYDYDENYNLIEYTIEPLGFEIEVAGDQLVPAGTGPGGEPLFESGNSTATVTSLTTLDGRPIDIDTAAVSDGWSIVVYEVHEWGNSELSRFQFDSNPQPVTVECLESVCDDDCIPTYDSSDNLLCICRDAEVNETDGYEYQPYEHNQTRPRYNEYTP